MQQEIIRPQEDTILDIIQKNKRVFGNVSKNDFPKYETNADEVVHTTQTGYGKELVPVAKLAEQALVLSAEYSKFLPLLPGNHGNNMGASDKVPVLAGPQLFYGGSEHTTGAIVPGQAAQKQATAEVQINQGQFFSSVDLSTRVKNYSVIDLQQYVINTMAAGAARSIDAYILNADDTATATGNVNLDDADPDTLTPKPYWYQHGGGLRDIAINGSSLAFDVSTLAFDDLMTLRGKLGGFASNPADCLWLTNITAHNKLMQLDEFKYQYMGGRTTITGAQLGSFLGSDVIVCEDLPLTEADGKVSTTAANNTKGSLIYVYKPAIQYGYGMGFQVMTHEVLLEGVNIEAAFEFGFAVAQKLAGETNSSVGLAYNF